MTEVEIRRAINASDVAEQASHYIAQELQQLLKTKPLVHFCLTGGTVGILTLKHLATNEQFNALDFARIHVWFGDERYVSETSSDRNANQAKEALLDAIAIDSANVHEFPSIESGLSAEDAAKDFEAELTEVFGDVSPAMDLMILGMGPDGHVASLFPGSKHSGLIVAETNSPKPPPLRLSMSMDLINSSGQIVFVVSGIDKAEVVERIHRDENCDLPAAQVEAVSQTVWFIDEAAGAAFWSC